MVRMESIAVQRVGSPQKRLGKDSRSSKYIYRLLPRTALANLGAVDDVSLQTIPLDARAVRPAFAADVGP